MRKLLSTLLVVAMLFALGAPALAEEVANYDDQAVPISDQPEEDLTGALVILHTNDVHGAIESYAKVAELKRQYEAAGADVLLVDAGDFSQGETYVSVSEGKSAVELMNLVGYDLAAPGNHEFDYGYDNLKTLAKLAQFPVLAANVLYENEVAFDCHVVMEVGGVRVGFLGLDTPETATKAHPAKIKGVTFLGGEEMYKAAQAEVDTMKNTEGAELIVCLGHLGIDEESAANGNRSMDLLNHVTGIDLFIDGHSHSTLEEVMAATNGTGKVGDTVLTSTGTKLANIGVVTVKDGVITAENIPADDVAVAESDRVAAAAQTVVSGVEELYGAVFAKSDVALDGERAPGNRTQETNLGDLICDAMLWYATKDGELDVPAANVVAITNGGGIRASVAAGDISRNDVNKVLPFGNTVATVYVSGAALLEALEASTFCTPTAVGGFPQVAGLSFTVDASEAFAAGELYPDTTYAAPASINRVTVNSVNGAPFDPAATYAVVTNDFVAAGGDTYYTFSTSPNIVDTGVPLDEALMAYITEVLDGEIGTDYAAPKGRITVKNVGLEPGAWYVAAARNVMEKGIMQGTGKGFEPGATVTRASVFQTLYNLEGKPVLADRMATFPDAQGTWFENAAHWAQVAGLTTGTGGGMFEGNREATRGEIVTILYRYVQYKNLDVSVGDSVNLLTAYADAENLNAWVISPFQWAVGAKVISGKMVNGNVGLMADETATRAELAQMLSNFTDFFTPSVQ